MSFLHNGVEDETLSGRFILPEERKKICPELTEFKCSEEFLLLSEPNNPAAAEIPISYVGEHWPQLLQMSSRMQRF